MLSLLALLATFKDVSFSLKIITKFALWFYWRAVVSAVDVTKLS